MKLRYKIFISILVVSLTALLSSSIYLINKYHHSNVLREQQRSLNEYDFTEASLSNSVDLGSSSIETLRLLLNRFGEYYENRGILISLYRDKEIIYSSFDDTNPVLQDMLNVETGTKMVQIIDHNNDKYIHVSGRPYESNNLTLIYSRNINEIYNDRNNNIILTLIFSGLLSLIIGFLSYLYSRWITKPIDSLQSNALSIAKGNYNIRLKESNDEFNDLRKAFHTMASAIENRTEELEERNKELQDFIDNLTHEMNTPLTSIQGYAEFLYNANASEEEKLMAVNNIREQSVRIKDIYTKLITITFTRRQDLQAEDVYITELFNDIYDTFLPQLQANDISFTMESQIETIPMDRTLMIILISNLIKNSIQALSQPGDIYLTAYYEDNKPVIEVRDTGSGIPEDQIKEVTKPFFRIDKSRSRKTGGAGLGLSISTSIARLHKARLDISSVLGQGTRIKIIFD